MDKQAEVMTLLKAKNVMFMQTCLSGKLYIEEPEGFVYGRVRLEKKNKKKK